MLPPPFPWVVIFPSPSWVVLLFFASFGRGSRSFFFECNKMILAEAKLKFKLEFRLGRFAEVMFSSVEW